MGVVSAPRAYLIRRPTLTSAPAPNPLLGSTPPMAAKVEAFTIEFAPEVGIFLIRLLPGCRLTKSKNCINLVDK